MLLWERNQRPSLRRKRYQADIMILILFYRSEECNAHKKDLSISLLIVFDPIAYFSACELQLCSSGRKTTKPVNSNDAFYFDQVILNASDPTEISVTSS